MKFNVLNIIKIALFTLVPTANAEVRLNQFLNLYKLGKKEVTKSSLTVSSNTSVTQQSTITTKKGEEILLLRTWMCPGKTGRKVKCTPPKIFNY